MVVYTIQPLVINTTSIAQKIAIRVEDIRLFTSVSVYYEIIDNTNTVIRSNIITINNNYPDWGVDDDFIYNYIAEQEGIIGENIQTITKQNTATKMSIDFVCMHLRSNSTFACKFFTSDGIVVLEQNVSLNDTNYSEWGTDDSYVIQKISELLNINPITIV